MLNVRMRVRVGVQDLKSYAESVKTIVVTNTVCLTYETPRVTVLRLVDVLCMLLYRTLFTCYLHLRHLCN